MMSMLPSIKVWSKSKTKSLFLAAGGTGAEGRGGGIEGGRGGVRGYRKGKRGKERSRREIKRKEKWRNISMMLHAKSLYAHHRCNNQTQHRSSDKYAMLKTYNRYNACTHMKWNTPYSVDL